LIVERRLRAAFYDFDVNPPRRIQPRAIQLVTWVLLSVLTVSASAA